MNKMYWVGVAVVVSFGIGLAVYLGGQTLNRELIGWTSFSTESEVVQALQEKIGSELRAKKVLLIGPHPQKALHMKTALELISGLSQKGQVVLVVDRILSERDPQVASLQAQARLDLVQDRQQMETILQDLKPDQKIIYLGPNIYVTHFLYQGPMASLRNQLKEKDYLVLSFTNFPISKETEKDFDFPCRTGESSASQMELGCLVLSQARKYYGRSVTMGKTQGFLNQVNDQEFMFFLGN